ncbi:hypothetical protein [Pararhodobacter marinus]|uniref:hypothetical protein n=1 Tax=Pararhodobacter marinus TaxID=2184063 RepID=UPI003517A946
MKRAISWGLPLLTLAVYLYLVVVLGQRLLAESGGLLPYDLRVTGYDLAQARGLLRALTPEGFALYEGPIFWTDTLFPALMGLCLLWWMRPFRGAFGMVCMMAAMGYVALDWGENMLVQRMLEAGPDWVRPADIFAASAFTQGKFAILALALVLAIRASMRRMRERGAE